MFRWGHASQTLKWHCTALKVRTNSGNRLFTVTDIRRLVAVQHWFHCAGKDNPADFPFRGVSLKQQEMSLMWKHGPYWLPKFSPAVIPEEEPMPEDCKAEKKNMSGYTVLVATENSTFGQLINRSCYNKLLKLLTR